jgi:hypothetical protein
VVLTPEVTQPVMVAAAVIAKAIFTIDFFMMFSPTDLVIDFQ